MPATAGLAHPEDDARRARRADTGTARLAGRDVAGLLLCAGQYAVRALTAAAAALTTLAVIPGTSSAPAIITGTALWWLLTARSDLAPPPGR